MGRAPCCEKVGLKKGRWTTEEDEILTKYIQTNGEGSWRSLPMKAGLLRCGKSCRLRWINYLRGDLKRGNITPEEEEVIIKLHSSYGNRWSLIAGHLPGRTDNEIKNYWNSHLSRRIHTVRRLNHDGVPVVLDIGKFVGGPKRRGGRTRRSAAFHKRTAQKMDQAPTSTATTKPNQLQKPGSGPTHNNVVVFSDVEKDSSLSGLSHDDFDNEMLCSDVMDPGAFWSSNEPAQISRDLSPPRGQRRETEEAAGAASDLSSDAFEDGIFGANYEVSDSAIWGSHRDKEDDLFSFGYEGLNDMVLFPNQVNEGGLWGSDDDSGTRFFASSKSGDVILQGDYNIPCLSYDLLENEFFRFNEVEDSVFWGSSGGAESDANMGFESTGLILSPNDLIESELLPTPDQNEQGRRRCEEDVENGSQGKVNVGCSSTTTTDLVLKSGEDHKRDNEWSSSGLMADWSWEGFEDKFREIEGGDVWPWLLGSSTADHNGGGGLGFEDELNKSYAAWVFPAETNVNL